jgi:hypothetical protein
MRLKDLRPDPQADLSSLLSSPHHTYTLHSRDTNKHTNDTRLCHELHEVIEGAEEDTQWAQAKDTHERTTECL